jgi:hypothetical protein
LSKAAENTRHISKLLRDDVVDFALALNAVFVAYHAEPGLCRININRATVANLPARLKPASLHVMLPAGHPAGTRPEV